VALSDGLGRIFSRRPLGLPAGVAAALRQFSPTQAAIFVAAALRVLDGVTLTQETAAGPTASIPVALDGLAPQLLFADAYVSGLDAPLQRDVASLLELLEYFPLLSGYRHRFTRLESAAQDRVLAGWEASRFDTLRQAFQGLKALCMLSHYQDERSFAAIGYSGPLIPKRIP
jgi:hypothetical protein